MKEVFIASAMVGAVFSIVVLLALAHRAGRIHFLDTIGDFFGKRVLLPSWVAFPSAVLVTSLATAVFGLYWDISLHLSKGRDPGPLANPSHYFILLGLLGAFSAGVFAIAMPKPGVKPSPYAVKLSEGWYAPLGGILISLSATFGLIGFPLDDVWHRLFGQDVTLWGPTHLLMLAGASLTLIGQAILLVEGMRSNDERTAKVVGNRGAEVIAMIRKASAAGGILIALSIYQGEFDFGIPQFRMVFDPILIMVAAGVALPFARAWAGKGGALFAAAFFLLVRGALTLIVSEGFGRPVAHFPIYLGAAFAVEIVGLLMADDVKNRPMRFATVAGVSIGTLGLASEWAWSHVWQIFSWPSALWPEGAIAGFLSAVCAAWIGVWMANSLALRPQIKGAVRFAPVAGALVIAGLVGYGLHQSKPESPVVAQVTTQTVDTGKPGKWVMATAKLNTTALDKDQMWTKVLAWQGPGLVNTELVKVGPGTYRTSEPVPAFGKWKTMMRWHTGDTMLALPIFEPADAAIPAAEVPASPSFTRNLNMDRVILQRESKVSGTFLPWLAYLTLLAIALLLLVSLAWGIWRVSRPVPENWADIDEPGPKATRTSGGTPKTTAQPHAA